MVWLWMVWFGSLGSDSHIIRIVHNSAPDPVSKLEVYSIHIIYNLNIKLKIVHNTQNIKKIDYRPHGI